MGYFNYFIKCIIRNIAYKLCKPKVLITVLLSICILFGLKHYGFCALSDLDYEMIADGLSTITSNQGTAISLLSTIGADVSIISDELRNINLDIESLQSLLSSVNSNVDDIENQMNTVISRLENLNSNIVNIYLKLDSNQKELLETLNVNNQQIITELQTENLKVLKELEDIKKILVGSSEDTQNQIFWEDGYIWTPRFPTGVSNVYDYDPGGGLYFKLVHFRDSSNNSDFVFEKGYTYTISVDRILNNFNGSTNLFYTYDNISYGGEIYSYYLGSFTQQNFSFTFTPVRSGTVQFFLDNFGPFWNQMITFTITSVPNGSLSSIGDSINQGNQLQQESNQLQQEQNDFLQQESSDSDVSVDGFNDVDSNDITSSGLSSIFTNIYNSISNWSSKDIKLPIPYTNTNITIPANYTYNMLNSFGGGWIITFVSSIYYFIVARFIIYSITSIINSIKSGSILETDSKNNITTDML